MPQLALFGHPGAACIVPCQHALCRLILMIASAPCCRCGKRIGMGKEYEETLDGRLFHAECPPKS